MRDRRSGEALAAANFAEASAETEEAATLYANSGEGLRHIVDRLEARTAEATELRVRLEITEEAKSTVRAELAEERRRREEAERGREDLRRELRGLREARESTQSPGPAEEEDPTSTPAGAQEVSRRPEGWSWWRKLMGR